MEWGGVKGGAVEGEGSVGGEVEREEAATLWGVGESVQGRGVQCRGG